MTSTVETNNCNILKKMEILGDIYNMLNTHIDGVIEVNFKTNINTIMDEYLLETASILNDYYRLKPNESKKKDEYTKKFHQKISTINISSRLQSIYNKLYAIYIAYTENVEADQRALKQISNLLNDYNNIKIYYHIEEIKHNNKCTNCNEYLMITDISEQSCWKCGMCRELVLVISDDDTIEIGPKYTSSSYDPSKHCKYWIDRIQAHEVMDMVHINIIADKVKAILNREKIRNEDYISCPLIREYLQKIDGGSNYNDHIPLIRKIITGHEPPQLTEIELQKINIYFIQIIKLYKIVKPSKKVNVPYHPYIIYKIIEQIIPRSRRQKEILECIHMQSRQTLIQNDNIWRSICDHIDEFKYIPTDRDRDN